MKLRKKMQVLALISATALLLVGCGGDKKSTSTSSTKDSKTTESQTTESTTEETEKPAVDLNALELPQLSNEVAEDESLVEMNTSMGMIKIKLFPKLVPKTVENFLTLAKKGYYNNLTFHRVIKDFMIQGGDPKGDGTGGESAFGKPFKDEFSNQLYNLRGALSMANSGPDTNGSQFFIVQNSDDQSNGLLKEEYPDKIIEAYKKGGAPHLDKSFEGAPQSNHVVFGQVIEGMDVVDKIANVPTKEEDRPKTAVTIDTIKIVKEAK